MAPEKKATKKGKKNIKKETKKVKGGGIWTVCSL